jgi:hypothetical protein
MYPYTHVVPISVTTSGIGSSGLASGGTSGAFTAFICGSTGVVLIQTIYGELGTIPVNAGVLYPIEFAYVLGATAGSIVGLK